MTRAQVARRRFKSSLPRKIDNVELSWTKALTRTADLFDDFRNEMRAAGANPEHVQAGLVFFQPHVKEILAQTVTLPTPEKIAEFAEDIMALDKPVFLGVLFLQRDPEAEKAGDAKQANVLFGVPFTTAHEAPARMLAARESQRLKGGLKKLVN